MSAEEDEMKEMVGGCCVCSDERGWDENPLVYCDGQGCNVAVHQACYGIVDVPVGPWYCRKCESHERSARVRCDLCPSRDGALKRTDQNGWAHVVCALYIPEVRFGNVTTMEPILVTLIPNERFHKTCYICEDNNRGSKTTFGACMQCNKPGCKQNFHVTCAQMSGLLCEEAGNMDNVKYCGYCQYHYGKLKTTRNMKIIPPFKPVPSSVSNGESPVSSPDKSGAKASSEEPKSSANTGSTVGSIQRSLSTPGASASGGEGSSGRKTSGLPNISPDIDTSTNSKNSKSSKKGSGGNSSHSGGSKLLDAPSSKSSSSITAKIAQPILTPATFSSTAKSINSDDKADSTAKGKMGSKEGESSGKNDDSLTIKLERVDNPLKNVSQAKKDFSNVKLNEVVSAALDRPMTSSNSKFDHISSALTSNIEPPLSSAGSGSSLTTGRHSLGDKPAPPDIKPHVTLTPIPMRGTRISLSRNDDKSKDDDHMKDSAQKSKSPISSASLSFHNSFGPPKLTSQTSSPDMTETGSKSSKPPDLSVQEVASLEKNGPPAKRSRGSSRDEDRGRKTPTKGRGGRRGTTTAAYSKRETSNNGFAPDEVTHDDPMEGSSRGGRSGPGRRPAAASRVGGRPAADDAPAPTLSQLKAQMETSADSTLSALPPHMFGNALNPASSMAQRMVDTLSQEMEAVVAAGAGGLPDAVSPQAPVIGIPLPGKITPLSNSVNGATVTPTPVASTSTSSAAAPPQTLEQLLERQWEQGSQFLMEQAQHLDIAQLLSCLNQLKQDNRALEEHVQSLVQRRDQLIAVNARLSVPLGNSNAMGSLGPGFSSSNGSAHNGHNGTPPPTLQAQGHINPNSAKGLQISSSSPSPQQHHELIMQQGRHVHREERSFSMTSEMQVSRTEIGGHAGPSSHHSGHHSQRNQNQNVAPYGYPGHPNPVPTSHGPLSHSHSSHHSLTRDSSR